MVQHGPPMLLSLARKDEHWCNSVLLPHESGGTRKENVHLGISMMGFPGDLQHRGHVRDPEPLSEHITEVDMIIMQCIHI